MHDARGKALKVGDLVMIPAVVTEVFTSDDYCNCTVVTQIGRRPDGQKEKWYSINSGVLLLVAADDGVSEPLT